MTLSHQGGAPSRRKGREYNAVQRDSGIGLEKIDMSRVPVVK